MGVAASHDSGARGVVLAAEACSDRGAIMVSGARPGARLPPASGALRCTGGGPGPRVALGGDWAGPSAGGRRPAWLPLRCLPGPGLPPVGWCSGVMGPEVGASRAQCGACEMGLRAVVGAGGAHWARFSAGAGQRLLAVMPTWGMCVRSPSRPGWQQVCACAWCPLGAPRSWAVASAMVRVALLSLILPTGTSCLGCSSAPVCWARKHLLGRGTQAWSEQADGTGLVLCVGIGTAWKGASYLACRLLLPSCALELRWAEVCHQSCDALFSVWA